MSIPSAHAAGCCPIPLKVSTVPRPIMAGRSSGRAGGSSPCHVRKPSICETPASENAPHRISPASGPAQSGPAASSTTSPVQYLSRNYLPGKVKIAGQKRVAKILGDPTSEVSAAAIFACRPDGHHLTQTTIPQILTTIHPPPKACHSFLRDRLERNWTRPCRGRAPHAISQRHKFFLHLGLRHNLRYTGAFAPRKQH